MANDPNGAAIALNRFGLGARPDDQHLFDQRPAEARQWLLSQFESYEPVPALLDDFDDSASLLRALAENMEDVRAEAADDKQAARKAVQQDNQAAYRAEVHARVRVALTTPAPFVERLVHFWSNHFAISIEKPQVTAIAGAYEREAIRPHVLGRFQDMLLAVERHPAMLYYLDQPRSTGPNSPAAERAAAKPDVRKRGINENLAREIMELHTLGARTGYTQQDVTEFALALSGWSVGNPRSDDAGSFAFRAALHEPGPRTILGKTYAGRAEDQGEAILSDLASAEATARHVAAKLARHFIADEPPPGVVDRLATAFTRSDGDLPTVYKALIDSPEAWAMPPSKFKTPWEWVVSALRGLGVDDAGATGGGDPKDDGPAIARVLVQLGQQVWKPGSPAGYDDIAGSWAAPDALMRRVEVAQRLATLAGEIDPGSLADTLLAGTVSPMTATEVGRAESRRSGVALLLVSPDFLRR